MTLRAAVIGCGRIGSRFDEGRDGPPVLTHAGAYQADPDFDLAALCDPDPERLREAATARGVAASYTDSTQLFRKERIDILSLCTPTPLRLPLIQQALESGVGRIFCEKPLAPTLDEANKIVDLVRSAGAVLAVNYPRSACPGRNRIEQLLTVDRPGTPQRISVSYTKGVANNASHFIHLLVTIFGPPRLARVLGRIEDGRNEDPSLDFVLDFDGATRPFRAWFLTSDHGAFAHQELDILCQRGRIRILDDEDKMEWSLVRDDPVFNGYRSLALAGNAEMESWRGLGATLKDLAAAVPHGHGTHGALPAPGPNTDLEAILDTVRICHALGRSSTDGNAMDPSSPQEEPLT